VKTILYIDGFNLYYSAVKDTPLKWLNPAALVARAFPHNQVVATKYFTAKVRALPRDTDQPTRQMIFWRALRTLPQFEIPQSNDRCHWHVPQTGNLVMNL